MKFLTTCVPVMFSALLLSACGSDTTQDTAPPTTQPIKNCQAWPEQLLQFEQQHNSAIVAMVAGADCSLYLAGYYHSSHPVQLSGNSTGFIRRVSLNAANQLSTDWTYHLDTAGTDNIDLLQWHGSELIFVGRTNAAIPGASNKGQFDLVAGKVTTQGTVVKISQFGTEKPDQATALVKAQADEWMLFGYTDVYIPSNYVDSWEDGLQIKLKESTTQFEMLAMYSSNSVVPDKFTSAVAVPNQAGLYLVGHQITEGAQRGVWLKQMNETGLPGWSSKISASPLDTLVHISKPQQDKVQLLGSTYRALGKTSFGGADIYSVQLNPLSGDLSEFQQYGTPQDDWVTAGWSDAEQQLLAGEITGAGSEASVAFSFRQKDTTADLNPIATQQDHFTYAVSSAYGLVFVAGQQVKGQHTVASINSRKLP